MGSKSTNDYQIKDVNCPSCTNEAAKLITHVLDIPYYKDFMMLNINCPKCGLRSSDFFNLNSKGYTRYTYHVNSIEDDETKIVRAKDGIVNIPELGMKIEPYNEPVTWIRNIEGLLLDFREKLLIIIKNPEDKKIRKLAEWRLIALDNMRVYKIPFTIIVEDKTGNSIILPAQESKLEIDYLEKIE